jgi:hypothetical protein
MNPVLPFLKKWTAKRLKKTKAVDVLVIYIGAQHIEAPNYTSPSHTWEEESDMHNELGLVRFCGPLDPLALQQQSFDLLFHEEARGSSPPFLATFRILCCSKEGIKPNNKNLLGQCYPHLTPCPDLYMCTTTATCLGA